MAAKERKKTVTYKGAHIRLSADFSGETMAENGMTYSKYWKIKNYHLRILYLWNYLSDMKEK